MNASFPTPPAASGNRPWRKWGRAVLGTLVLGLVVLGMAGIFRKAGDQFSQHGFSLTDLRIDWLAAAAGLYLLGATACALFWHLVLRDMGQSPQALESLRAYFVGGLGKYIPGKAMVVVLRAGMLKGPRVDAAVAGLSVFVETLTMMAVGATLAAGILALNVVSAPEGARIDHRALWLALALGPVCAIPTLPFVFRRIVRLFRVHRLSGEVEAAVAGLGFRTMATGWLLMAAAWVAMGLSLWATLHAIPEPFVLAHTADEHWMLAIAAAALAVVAGFLSPLPAGLGIRDFVVMAIVATTFGEAAALLSGGLLRVVWLVAEVAFSTILYLALPRTT